MNKHLYHHPPLLTTTITTTPPPSYPPCLSCRSQTPFAIDPHTLAVGVVVVVVMTTTMMVVVGVYVRMYL